MSQMTFLIPSVTLPFTVAAEEAIAVARRQMRKAGLPPASYTYRIYRRSVDARKRDLIRFVYSVAVCGDFSIKDRERMQRAGYQPVKDGEPDITTGEEALCERPVVVGTGPAGLFCALLLAEHGFSPLVLERGGTVEERLVATERFRRERILDPENNVQFGAGGAGTFSDGKLVTRVNHPWNGYVLSRLVSFGAPPEIAYLAKPHVGTDILQTVVSRMLSAIVAAGGEVRYHARLADIRCDATGSVRRVILGDGEEIPCGLLVLAVGHSARDTYEMLLSHGAAVEAKPFSVGLRIEHLQQDIDRAMYGDFAGHPLLGHAEYTLSDRTGARGVYTFCMCPGGEVVPAASEIGGVVVNGMSEHARGERNANAAIAVSVEPADFGSTPQGAIAFQRRIEQEAFRVAGSDYSAPSALLGDFLAGKEGGLPSRILPSYMSGGVCMASPDRYLPSFVTDSLRYAIPRFASRIEGYDVGDAVLTGPETRTSAPVRILRHEKERTAIGMGNLYPAGEGAGYAGGITSAALDGLATAVSIIARYKRPHR